MRRQPLRSGSRPPVPAAALVPEDILDAPDDHVTVGTPTALPRDRWGRHALALFVYVALSLATLTVRDNVVLLNWVVGPLFLVTALFAVPSVFRAASRRLRSR